MGLHGLVADNIISAKLVIADGSLVEVSATQHPDLYWAVRGAGHNFGVVVEMKYRIHDPLDADNWTHAAFVYGDDKLEQVFAFVERFRSIQPPELTIFTSFVANPNNSSVQCRTPGARPHA